MILISRSEQGEAGRGEYEGVVGGLVQPRFGEIGSSCLFDGIMLTGSSEFKTAFDELDQERDFKWSAPMLEACRKRRSG